MSVRIFSCSNNLENLKICIKEKVIGFRRMHNDISTGDIIYMAIRMPKINHCCAKAVISNITDFVPWENPELYVLCYRIENIEFCNPFSLDFLKNTSAGDAWGAIFIRGSLSIKDKDALTMLSENFNKNTATKFYPFKYMDINPPKGKRGRKKKEIDNNEDEQNLTEEPPVEDDEDSDDSFVDIMSTFKVVKFQNETDKNFGLESLVNNNLTALGGFVPIIDPTTGKITGYKTTVGGADTVFPFSDDMHHVYISATVYLRSKYMPTGNFQDDCYIYVNITLTKTDDGGFTGSASSSLSFSANNGGTRMSFSVIRTTITSLTWD